MKPNQIYLIVDDDHDDIDFFCEAMAEINDQATCIEARHGEEALQLLRQGSIRPDCIFMDLNMPRMNGKTCLAELKMDAKLKNIPVCIYTTSTHIRDREETMKLGADLYMNKATSFKSLRENLIKALDSLEQGQKVK